jgi:hypothetical protein
MQIAITGESFYIRIVQIISVRRAMPFGLVRHLVYVDNFVNKNRKANQHKA